MRNKAFGATWVVACCGLLAACGGSSSSAAKSSCGVEGRVETCACASGTGAQTCLLTGEWDACRCNGALGGGPHAGSSGGAGSNATGSAGQGGTLGGFDAAIAHDGGVLGGGGTSGNPLDAATMTPDASTKPALYSPCNTDKDCGGDGRVCATPFGGGFMGGGAGQAKGGCTKPCTMTKDCPAPTSGTATVTCSSGGIGSGSCALVCTAGQTCPTGLHCASNGISGICY